MEDGENRKERKVGKEGGRKQLAGLGYLGQAKRRGELRRVELSKAT